MSYAFVVASNERYLPEITALLNSLDYIGNKHPVYLLGYRLPEDWLKQLDKLDYQVVHRAITDEQVQKHGEAEMLMRLRYSVGSELSIMNDAVCVLDADMLFCRPVDQFFEIAAKTDLCLGAALEQKRWYGEGFEDNHRVNGEHIIPKTWNVNDFCCCPLFFSAEWHKVFERSWDIFAKGGFRAPDMDAINIAVIEAGKTDRVLLLPNVQFVGSNEKHLKAFIRTVWQEGDQNIWTETGEPIYTIHGQFYKAIWRDTQLANQHRCCEWYLKSEHAKGIADGAMELLHKYFLKMLDHKIQIEKKEYSPRGGPDSYGEAQ